ncbi:hypothetical protein COV17_01080 [Candidatus Woesearchaeota archaeon CG10_big_fil_rev_8_21_14_0_10_36_11]|nr:MAG: hypothetical protein COV17_01080 [Candidatus Woesearchaeota archaeon CG10_big_fil_rev_8_21_14_0_10_36_11]
MLRVSYNSFHVGSFVHGKAFALVKGVAQDRVQYIFEHLEEFIVKNAPIIEDVHLRIKRFNETKYREIHTAKVETDWREDISDCSATIGMYKKTLSFMDTHIQEMDPHYNMAEFLVENGIPGNEIDDFKKEVGELWGESYWPIFNRLKMIRVMLETLHNELEIQIGLLSKLRHTNYIQSFDEVEEI